MARRFSSALIGTLMVVAVSSQVSREADEVSGENKDSLKVSKELLRFMMSCSSEAYEKKQSAKGPLQVTDIGSESGTKSQHLTLVDMNDFEDSIKSAVYSGSVIRHIMGQVQGVPKNPETAEDDHEAPSFRHTGCTVGNNITISVPSQGLNDVNEHLTQILQQNSRLLLEQFNPLITYKLNRLNSDVENLISQRVAVLNGSIDKILSKLEETKTNLGEKKPVTRNPPSDVRPLQMCAKKGICEGYETKESLPGPKFRTSAGTGGDEETIYPLTPDFPRTRLKVRHPYRQSQYTVSNPFRPLISYRGRN